MARKFDLSDARGRERIMRDLVRVLRQLRPDLMAEEHRYRSPAGFCSWADHWARGVTAELAQEESESRHDHVAIWAAMVSRWAREINAELRVLSPALAQAFPPLPGKLTPLHPDRFIQPSSSPGSADQDWRGNADGPS